MDIAKINAVFYVSGSVDADVWWALEGSVEALGVALNDDRVYPVTVTASLRMIVSSAVRVLLDAAGNPSMMCLFVNSCLNFLSVCISTLSPSVRVCSRKAVS